MSEENLDIWNRLNKPPPEALRPIKDGRLKGKSDINPQWRYKTLTEEFGPYGIGWKYTIDKLWTEQGKGIEICVFALVSLYVKNTSLEDPHWREATPGIGGSKLVKEEAKGPYTNDEAYKMAVTDALSVACKMHGVAADIYMGLWDGSKYHDKPDPMDQTPPHDNMNQTSNTRSCYPEKYDRRRPLQNRRPRNQTVPAERGEEISPGDLPYDNNDGFKAPPLPDSTKVIGQAQLDNIKNALVAKKISKKDWLAYLKKRFKINGMGELTMSQYDEVVSTITTSPNIITSIGF